MNEPITLTQDSITLHGMMDNSTLQGECRIEDGERVLAQLMYRDGLLHGSCLIRHSNGHVSARLPYIEGKLHGMAEYYTEDSIPVRREQWRDGMRHGESYTLFADGSTQEIARWQRNVLHGERLRFHPNGRLAERQVFHRGQPLSVANCYSEDGRALSADGKPVPWWRHYLMKWTTAA